jgi:hypothetical protein
VNRGDRGLQLVGAERLVGERFGDEGDTLVDARALPEASVLLGEGNEAAVSASAGRSPRVCQQHERQETGDLSVLRKQSPDIAGESNRLRGQLASLQVGTGRCAVAFVEDQIEDVQDDSQPLGALGLRRQAERDAAFLDALLRPADALRDRRLRDEERTRDLGGR